jgi:hypothetical protein
VNGDVSDRDHDHDHDHDRVHDHVVARKLA